MEYLAKGKRGLTYLSEINGKKVVIKERNPRAVGLSTLKIEFDFLKKVNKHNIGPKVLHFENNKITMEYIDGDRIIDYMQKNSKKKILEIVKKILLQCRKLDKLQINKSEMTYPYKHIIVRDHEPVMIDFERARVSKEPQNTTQFCQFLLSGSLKYIFEEKKMSFDPKKVIEATKAYKKSYKDKDFNELLKVLEL